MHGIKFGALLAWASRFLIFNIDDNFSEDGGAWGEKEMFLSYVLLIYSVCISYVLPVCTKIPSNMPTLNANILCLL